MALLTDLIGSFVLGLIDGAVKKWVAPYVASGKLTAQDQKDILAGINADVKLGLVMEHDAQAASQGSQAGAAVASQPPEDNSVPV